MTNVRPSWFNYAMTAPADREAFELLSALTPVAQEVHEAAARREAFLTEAEELGLEVNRFHYLTERVKLARKAFLDAGGDFGGFRDGVFHEPTHPVVQTPHAFMEDVIDRQTLLRLHVLSMLEAREAAREAKAAKDAAKAAEKAAKAAAKAAVAQENAKS